MTHGTDPGADPGRAQQAREPNTSDVIMAEFGTWSSAGDAATRS